VAGWGVGVHDVSRNRPMRLPRPTSAR
jgi:hypothetical protein